VKLILAAVIALVAAVLVIGQEDSMKDERTAALELLGLKVKDRVTGFTGVVSSICFDLYGCIQAIVSPAVDDKGAMPDGKWIDVSRLEVLDPAPVMEIPGGRFAGAAVGTRTEREAGAVAHGSARHSVVPGGGSRDARRARRASLQGMRRRALAS
jgi:hypothetical protein